MDEHIFNHYLKCDVAELKTEKARQDLILNANKYEFIWFAQRASAERIQALLSDDNIDVLLSSQSAKDKVEGLFSGYIDNNLLKNQKLCDFMHDNPRYYFLLNQTASDYLDYIEQNHPGEIPSVFASLDDGTQIHILKTKSFDNDTINTLLSRCRKRSMQYLLDNDSRVILDDIKYPIFDYLACNGTHIPERLMSDKVVQNISTIHDVNQYRFLIESLKDNNDVEQIEKARKEHYEKELKSINEEGLLPEYAKLKQMLNGGALWDCIDECLGNFDSNAQIHYALESSENINETIQKLNNYQISNIIIDYFFENIPTNVLADINEMVNYQNHRQTLNEIEYSMYALLSQIDDVKLPNKLLLFEKLKNKDLIDKFYDDYNKTKDDMVEDINESILNEKNIAQFESQDLSKLCGVPIYELKGQPFKALIRGWGQDKSYALNKNHIEYHNDGASFSIDGSDLLAPYQDPKENYTIAYSGIPKKQLIHAFPNDSYTNYSRNFESGVPDKDTIGTRRLLKLLSPDELTSTTDNYNEILISVPNARKNNNDFDKQLEEPKPLAIYCYDTISMNDIKAAKELGKGIIIIHTKDYEIDKSNRLNRADTLAFGKDVNEYDYMAKGTKDIRLKVMLSKPLIRPDRRAKTVDQSEID